jgi:hypothetical protein
MGLSRWSMVVGCVLVFSFLVVACGSDENQAASEEDQGASQSTTTMSLVETSTSATTTSATSTTLGEQEGYAAEMQKWFDKYEEDLDTKADALGDIEDPFSAPDQAVQVVEDFADLMDQAADDLEDIEPPAQLSSAHSDYLAALNDMATGLSQFAKALKDIDLSTVLEASMLLETATEKGTTALSAIEDALGFSFHGEGDGQQTGGELGSRENPIPIGQEVQVGPWTVKVIETTLDADDIVYNHNEFNELPQAGNQYVIVKLEATRTGEEAAAFWVDMYYQFVGSKGNTFDAGYADIPDNISDTNEAYPGATISGNLLFEVASDQVAGGTLRLSEAFSFEDVEVFFAVE